MLIQQGDCLVESVDSVPEGAVPGKLDNGQIVLAYGEQTGHKHAIEDVAGVKFLEKDGMYYLVNDKEMTVRHEEHLPITIPPGIWRVKGVREYDHWTEEARVVRD